MKKVLPILVFALLLIFLLPLACGKKSGSLNPSPGLSSDVLTLKGGPEGGAVLALQADDWDALHAGSRVQVSITVSQAEDLYQFASRLTYDPARFKALEVINGGFLGQEALFIGAPRETGIVPIAGTIKFAGSGKNGDGVLACVVFEKLVDGPVPESAIRFNEDMRYVRLRDSSKNDCEFSLIKGVLR